MNLSREITKLRRTATRLAGGENIQITALMPVARMADSRERAARFLALFFLQKSSGRFYPDFICELPDGRILVVEYKGADRWKNAGDGELLDLVYLK